MQGRGILMARIRTLKPEFWHDEDMALLSAETRLLAIGLLNLADDEGYFKAHPSLIRGAIFPFTEGSLNIHGMLTELSSVCYVRLFEGSDGKQYGQVTNFTKHQKVNRPTPSKIKEKDRLTDDSLNAHGALIDGKERKGKELRADESAFGFVGETIRLNTKDFESCLAQYKNLDIHSQLSQLDLELKGKKNWFVEMHSKLNYRNNNPAHHSSARAKRYI